VKELPALAARFDFLLVLQALFEWGVGLILNAAADAKRRPFGERLATAGTGDWVGVTHRFRLP
jgi:hypothetical protein